MNSPPRIPVETLHLFPVLDELLLALLRSLPEEEWHACTIAPLWTVKDITAHLLDGNLKTLSASRDHHFGENAENIQSYSSLVRFINRLNHMWTDAAKRLSPAVLIDLLETTGRQFIRHLHELDPFAPAIYPVAWAGQTVSPNWFHIAREYTEKFLHQQQIRDAVGKQALFTRELFYPFIDTFLYALPPAYGTVAAEPGTTVEVMIRTHIGGSWRIVRTADGWEFTARRKPPADARVIMDPDTAWKLFSKGIGREEALQLVELAGDRALAIQALLMVSVMA